MHEVDITNSKVSKVLRNDNPSNLSSCYFNINSGTDKFTDFTNHYY